MAGSALKTSETYQAIPVNNTPLSKNTPLKCPKYFLRGVFLSTQRVPPLENPAGGRYFLGILYPKQSRKRCFRRVKTYSDMHKTKKNRLRRAKWCQTNQNLSVINFETSPPQAKIFRCVFRVFQLNSRILTKILLKNTPP